MKCTCRGRHRENFVCRKNHAEQELPHWWKGLIEERTRGN